MLHAEDIRAQITALLAAKDPAKVPKVDALLERYAGHEDALLAALQRKYNHTEGGASPSTSPTSPPGAIATAAVTANTSLSLSAEDVTSATPLASASEDRLKPFRARLHRLYVTHCPARVPFVEHDLKKYPGREEEVIQAAARRFGPEPSEEAPAPTTSVPAQTPPDAPHVEASSKDAEVAQPDETPRDSYLARLTRIYERYAPERVAQAPKHLAKYAGHEEEVIRAAVRHFGPEPAPDAAATTVTAARETMAEEAPREDGDESALPTPQKRERVEATTLPAPAESEASALPGALPDPATFDEARRAFHVVEEMRPMPAPLYAYAEQRPTSPPAPVAEPLWQTPSRENAHAASTMQSQAPPAEATHVFSFVPTPQPVTDLHATTAAFEISPMPETDTADAPPAVTEPEIAQWGSTVPASVAEPLPVAEPASASAASSSSSASAVAAPAFVPEPAPAPATVLSPASSAPSTPAAEADVVVHDAPPITPELEACAAKTVANLFKALAVADGPKPGAAARLVLTDKEMCAYLMGVATTEKAGEPRAPAIAAPMTQAEFLVALQRETAGAGVPLASAVRRLQRVLAHLGPRDVVSLHSEPINGHEPRCFWCHWCVLPAVGDRWRRAWATLVPASRVLRICYPNSTRVEWPIAFGHVLTCQRDVFTTRRAAPHPFATNGVRLTFSTDATPLQLLLCLERADDAQAIVAAFRAYESQSKRRTPAHTPLSDTAGNAQLTSHSASSVRTSRAPRAEGVRVWWCRDGQRRFHASTWSSGADGASLTVSASDDQEDGERTAPGMPFPSLESVSAVVDECDCPVPSPDQSAVTRYAFALALADQSFVYCYTSLQSERKCTVEWMRRHLARQAILRVPLTEW